MRGWGDAPSHCGMSDHVATSLAVADCGDKAAEQRPVRESGGVVDPAPPMLLLAEPVDVHTANRADHEVHTILPVL